MVGLPSHVKPPRGERTSTLVANLRSSIASGIIRAGGRLPSVRQLAADWGVSRFTAVEVYDRLVAEGWAEARRGSGFYAKVPSSPAPAAPVRSEAPPEGPNPAWLLGAMLRTCEVDRSPGAGLVPPSWLDLDLVSRALRTSSRDAGGALTYGDAQGNASLRTALARRLNELSIPASPEGILTTMGATQALDLVASALVSPGDVVLVDDPAFFVPFAQLAAHGAHVLGVPWAGDGPDMQALEALLVRHRPRCYLTTATVHNPTGGGLAPAKAHKMLKLAEATGTWILEDDVYGELALHPSPHLAALDGLNRVIYLSSFSKTLAPGWRLGYLAAPPALMPKLVECKLLASITTPQPAEVALASILEDGAYRRHVARLRDRIARTRAIALKAVATAGFTPYEPDGDGLFVWAQAEVDTQVLASALWSEGILLAAGTLFSPDGRPSCWTRINVAAAEQKPLMAALAAAHRDAARRA
jgi:DNA-binding transcriptional MocR family regulator